MNIYRKFVIAIILAALGFAGNYLALPIAFSVSFIFGSIFSIVAIGLLGPWWGVGVALVASSYTVILWNHPYALIIFVLEAIWIGIALKRGRMFIVLVDAVFWLCIGWLLVVLFYSGVMGLNAQATAIIVLKQAINGVFNALVASILLYHTPLSRIAVISVRTTYDKLVYHCTCAFLMFPLLSLLFYMNYRETASFKTLTANRVQTESYMLAGELEAWLKNHVNAAAFAANLGNRLTLVPSARLQDEMRALHNLFPAFSGIFLADAYAVTVAADPPVNAKGTSNIGISFADREYYRQVAKTGKPIVSEALLGKHSVFEPLFVVAFPLLKDGSLFNFAIGSISSNNLLELIRFHAEQKDMLITIIDGKGKVIVSTDKKREPLKPLLVNSTGQMVRVSPDVSLWIPGTKKNSGVMQAWKGAYYLSVRKIAGTDWTMRVEYPLAPMQKQLYANAINALSAVALLFLPMIGIAFAVSRYLTRPLLTLAGISADIPAKVEKVEEIVWPRSDIAEVETLTFNFRKTSEALSSNITTLNNRLTLAADSAQIGVWDWDVAENRLQWDKWMYALYGVREENFDGAYEAWQNGLHPDDRTRGNDEIGMALRGEKDFDTEFRVIWPRGEVHYIKANALVIRDDNGKPLRMIGVNYDITERKLAALDLEMARDAAETANRAKSRFLANMSHEIRTPMNGIIGLGHLAMQTEMSPKMRDYLCKITYSAESLMGVLNDILDFSKIEAGMLTIEKTSFSTAAMLERVAALQTINAENKGLEVLFSVDHTVPPCLIGDQLRLQQVLGNLLNNAIKFTETGSVLLTVSTIHRDMNSRQATLCFSINDTGIGIPPDQLERLFLPFTQSDGSTTRKYGGTGLGLSICQSLVELMGGTLTARSMPDKGSTFSFTLSFGIGDVFEHPECIPDNSGFSSLRTLVADDNPTALQVMGEMLQWWELRVTPVSSGPGALAEIVKESRGDDPYRLLLLDWRMPELDGLELVRCLKAELTEGLMPTVFITTAFGNESLREEAASLGVRAFIAKPVFPRDLHHVIRSALSAEPTEITTAAREVVSAMPVDGLSGVRVVLAEDNPINTQLAVELLERVGVSVTIASNGREAVDLVVAANGNFDLVLMDIQMPVMDGHEATQLLREYWDKNQLPIVAMTAHAMNEERERCLASGMNDHLAKPINPDELFRVVATMAGKDIASILQPLAIAVNTVQLPENLPGLNIQDTLKRFLNDQRFMADTMSNFVAGSQDTAEQIMDAASRDDREELKRSVHTLKGLSGNVGAVDVNAACKQMESLLRDNSDTKRIIEQADTIRNLMDRAFESIIIITTQINSSMSEKPAACGASRDAIVIFHELQQALKDMNFESIALTRELIAALPGSCETGVLFRQVEGLDFKGALVTLATLVDKVTADEA